MLIIESSSDDICEQQPRSEPPSIHHVVDDEPQDGRQSVWFVATLVKNGMDNPGISKLIEAK